MAERHNDGRKTRGAVNVVPPPSSIILSAEKRELSRKHIVFRRRGASIREHTFKGMMMKATALKSLDMVAYSLLLIGALNWGLIGLFNFDLVAAICGSMTLLSRLVYAIVGLAAVYDLMSLPSIMRRWDIHVRRQPVHA